jgi:hypothetical protein
VLTGQEVDRRGPLVVADVAVRRGRRGLGRRERERGDQCRGQQGGGTASGGGHTLRR